MHKAFWIGVVAAVVGAYFMLAGIGTIHLPFVPRDDIPRHVAALLIGVFAAFVGTIVAWITYENAAEPKPPIFLVVVELALLGAGLWLWNLAEAWDDMYNIGSSFSGVAGVLCFLFAAMPGLAYLARHTPLEPAKRQHGIGISPKH